jgi:hypothetical protein
MSKLVIAIAIVVVIGISKNAMAVEPVLTYPQYIRPPLPVRSGRADFLIFGQFLGGDNLPLTLYSDYKGQPQTVQFKFEHFYGVGIQPGYNINNFLRLHIDMSLYSELPIKAVYGKNSVSDTPWCSTLTAGADFYFLPSEITPYIMAEGGIFNAWGTVHGNAPYELFYEETDFTYATGAGMRFDLGKNFTLQGGFRMQWISFNGDLGTGQFPGGWFAMGWRSKGGLI